ncbi:MAG: carbon-nitrogen hydrolase family protein [Actinomycetota bacterium]|nr:carbon-nitrogen hydrolase family protein [Actinomycetota bacterium]
MKSRIRLGVVQPETYWGAEERRNLREAIGYVESASRLGIDLLAFPENYPGPYRAAERYEVVEPMQAASAEHRVSLAFGTSLETAPGSDRYHIATVLTNDDGSIAGICRRTHPRGPYIYLGGDLWDFHYQEADEIEPIDMGWGKVGVATCSEAFVPEVARLQALRGAELCLFPTGIVIDELGYTDNWRTLVRARAIENLMYTALTVHLFRPEFADRYRQSTSEHAPSASGLTRGIAMVCSPERILTQSEAPGIVTADLDLDRVRHLRETKEELIVPAPYQTIPGVLSWRRPELLGGLTGGAVEETIDQEFLPLEPTW